MKIILLIGMMLSTSVFAQADRPWWKIWQTVDEAVGVSKAVQNRVSGVDGTSRQVDEVVSHEERRSEGYDDRHDEDKYKHKYRDDDRDDEDDREHGHKEKHKDKHKEKHKEKHKDDDD